MEKIITKFYSAFAELDAETMAECYHKDVVFEDDFPVVMTEKDAVKCIDYATKDYWYLPIIAVLPDSFTYRLEAFMKDII